MKSTCLAAFIGAALSVTGAASAATIVIVNNNAPGEGFNDPTPVAPLPSNPATTLGEQRLAVFQAAADRWGELLESSVVIQVRAQFSPQTCTGTSAVLGSAGAVTIHRNFTNAPRPDTWYSQALANAMAGTDLNAAQPDINSTFNVSIDTGTCLNGTSGWYYTTSISDQPPSDRLPLLPVVFHELGHGLGFQTFTDRSTGAFNGGFPDIWAHFLYDTETGKTWINMTNAERAASSLNDPDLVWKGPHVTADKELYLGPTPSFFVNAPAAIAGVTGAQTASFGPAVPESGVTGDVVAAISSGSGAAANEGCTAFLNAAAVSGKIALVNRGTCNFTVKVANAQAAGAVAVIVANNTAGLPGMGGDDPSITIPSYGIQQAVGDSIRAQLAASQTVNVTLGYDATNLSGTRKGYVRHYAPPVLEAGSSVSHFTTDAFPNVLMEPALNTSIFNEVDLTGSLFRDIGWQVNELPQILIFPTHGAPEGGFED